MTRTFAVWPAAALSIRWMLVTRLFSAATPVATALLNSPARLSSYVRVVTASVVTGAAGAAGTAWAAGRRPRRARRW